MAEDAKKEKSSDEHESAPSAGGGKLGTILSVANLFLTLGIGAVVFLQFQKDKHHEAVGDIQSEASSEKPAEHGGGEHGGGEHGAEKKEEPAHGGGHGEAPAAAGHGESGHGEAGKSATSEKLITLEQFTVNLSTSPGMPSRFARVVVAVEVSSGEAATEINSKMAPVRNAIIDLFNSKRPADLQTGEGRNFLKEEIRNALNGFLVTGKVKGVFFSNFAVSS